MMAITARGFAYLACPYSHPDLRVREQRFRLATAYAARLIAEGIPVFSPITHGHPIERALPDGPASWEAWQELDLAVISVCAKVIVFMLEGWDTSTGVAAEILYAGELGKPVEYVEP